MTSITWIWFDLNLISLIVRFEQRTSCGANEVGAPKCHTAHSQLALTGMKTLETLWLNLAAIITYSGGLRFTGAEGFLSLLLRSLMFSVPSTDGTWEEAAGEKLPAACSPDENEGKLWWIFMTVLTVPSWAICPVFPNEPRFKISNCLEDACLRHCCFVFVNTSASHLHK